MYFIYLDVQSFMPFSLAAIILSVLSYNEASMFDNGPQFTVKAEANKEFDKSCLIGTFNTGDMADCLEHCLKDCRCQSFQICRNTKCQLCSNHKEDNGSLLQENDSCIYATYEMQQLTKTLQVKHNLLIHRIQNRLFFDCFKIGNVSYDYTGLYSFSMLQNIN